MRNQQHTKRENNKTKQIKTTREHNKHTQTKHKQAQTENITQNRQQQ